jgi:hypothetical protein
MAKTPDDRRLDLLQGTLDMLILRTLQWGPQHGHGIGQAIRTQSDDLLKVETGEQDRWSQLVHAIGRIMNPATGEE